MDLNEINFSPKQLLAISRANAWVNIFEGAVRSGKTYSSLYGWLLGIRNVSKGDLFLAARTERTLKRNILNTLSEWLGPGEFSYSFYTGEGKLFGRNVALLSATDESAEQKVRGATFARGYGDEVSTWPESFFKRCITQLSVDKAEFWGTTNPDSPYHWLKKGWIDKADGRDINSFHFNLTDNWSLSKETIRRLKESFTGLWFKRFILGLWVMAEGAIYDMFNEDIHLVNAPPIKKDSDGNIENYLKVWVGYDHGINNPCTFGLYGKHQDDNIYKLREYWFDSNEAGYQKTDSQYADDFEGWLDGIMPDIVWGDPSASGFQEELRQRGFDAQDAHNEVIPGITFMSNLLAGGKYKIDRSCKHAPTEYVGYAWDPKAQARGEDKPLKQNDHAVDCDRYALYSEYFFPEPDIL